MKKMSIPNKLERSFSMGGRSIESGIILNLSKEYNLFKSSCSQRITSKKLAVYEDKKIKVYGLEGMKFFIEEENNTSGKRGRVILSIWILLILASLVMEMISIYALKDMDLARTFMALFFIFLGTLKSSGHLVEKVMAMCGNKNIQKKLRHHAAEHMAVNAYYDLKRVPTFNELMEYSTYAINCSVRQDVDSGIAFFILGLSRLIPDSLLFFLVFLIAIGIYFILSKVYNLDVYTEIISLQKPTKRDCRIALACLKAVTEDIDEAIDYFDSCKTNPYAYMKMCKLAKGLNIIVIDRFHD